MKTTSFLLCMCLAAGLIGVLLFDYQQHASAQMGMGMMNPNMMMNRTGMIGMMGNMTGSMMNPNMMGNMMMNPMMIGNMMGMMNPNMMGMGHMMNPNMMMNPSMMGNMIGMMNPNMMGNMMNSMMMSGQNITGSIKLVPTMFNSISSQIKVSLSDAAASAQRELGNNSRAVAGHLDVVNGYLTYTIWAIDPDMNIHTLIIDAGNGSVLSSSKLSWQNMMMNPMMMGMGSTWQ